MIRLLFEVLDGPGRRALRRVIAVFAVVGVLQGFAFALLVPILDTMFHREWGRGWTWIAVLGAVLLAHHVTLTLGARAGYDLSCRLLGILQHRLGDHVARLPLGWFGPDRTGPLGRMVGKGCIDIASVPSHLLRQLIAAAVTPLTVMVVIFALQWQLGLILLAGVLAIAGAARLLAAIIGQGENAYDASIAEGSGRIVEFALHQPALRVFGRTVHGNRLVDDALDHQERTQRRLTVTGFGGMGILLLALQTLLTAIIAVAVHLTLGGTLEPATMIAVLVLAVRFVEPLLGAGELTGVIRLAQGALQRVLEVLNTPTLPEPDHPSRPADASVAMHEVTFGYRPDQPVLRGVSFTAPPRSLTAIVGPSGSGKTTMLRLLARFYDVAPDAGGAVLIGGQDVRQLGSDRVIDQTGIVFQDVYLFEGTLRENILLSRPDASEDDLRRAAELARVDEIVARLPAGWDTRVGEGGSTLSGGEKQRVSIARALLKDAPIVLLDEATAALDPQNEATVQQALTALAADRTVIVIAHRLQTVVAADQILVLADGRIVERGTHAELLTAGGRYREFWVQRTQAAGWRLAG